MSDVALAFQNFPLPMHPWAHRAAEIGSCTNLLKPEAFWILHDYLFENQSSFSEQGFTDQVISYLSHNAGVPAADLMTCVEDPKTAEGVEAEIALGRQVGVEATPTLFVNGRKIEGTPDASQLRDIILQIKQSATPVAPR